MTVLGRVEQSGHAVDPDLVRLEDRANLVVLLLEDRVVHVVVAAGTAERHAQEGLAGVVDHVLHPLLAAQELEVPRKVAGGAEGVQVIRTASSAASIATTMRSYGLSLLSDSTIQSRQCQMCGWLSRTCLPQPAQSL